MYKHILIPIDGSPLSEGALRQGMALARALHAKVTVLTVSPPFHSVAVDPAMVTATPAQHFEESQARADKVLSMARAEADVVGVACETMHVTQDHPYQAILDTAWAKGCDLIAMASHGRGGVSALILGSETSKVLAHGKIPVLVCR